ncbi:MAG TPA: glycosyltransferase family 4 protein [Verrucomicrobiae bacterium]|nr:glycosyltransferase family 4 protein [Verrucomicrobiae bacterium]
MKITMLHYHLRPGGVTTVIRNAQRALAPKYDVEVLADVGYNARPARSRAQFIAEARELLRRLPRTDVLHAHNVGLGKNPRLSYAVRLLAERGGVRVINQVHDFPEENRPAQLHALRYCTGRRDDVFWREMCYYDLPNVRWATLTSRDAAKLAARGVPARKIHVLPNPVDDELFTRPRQPTPRDVASWCPYLLSPMKVMERKNNAEAVELVKRLGRYRLIISLDASSPRDRAYRDRLERWIRRERLPVIIGVGSVLDDALPLFDAAHAIVTTSRQEGFGYAFLEGWLRGKLVVGRDIPEVTRDFAAEGLDLRHLYHEFNDTAVTRIAKLLARPPRQLIEHNRRVVLEKYSLRAYTRRYEALLGKFTGRF